MPFRVIRSKWFKMQFNTVKDKKFKIYQELRKKLNAKK